MYYSPWPNVKFCYSALETLDFWPDWCHNTYMKNNETVMSTKDWEELYVRVYAAYDYAGLRNETVRALLGEALDNLMGISPKRDTSKDTPMFDEVYGG